jgi:hypothetical protein
MNELKLKKNFCLSFKNQYICKIMSQYVTIKFNFGEIYGTNDLVSKCPNCIKTNGIDSVGLLLIIINELL